MHEILSSSSSSTLNWFLVLLPCMFDHILVIPLIAWCSTTQTFIGGSKILNELRLQAPSTYLACINKKGDFKRLFHRYYHDNSDVWNPIKSYLRRDLSGRIRTSNIRNEYIFYVVEIKSKDGGVETSKRSVATSVFRAPFDGRKQIPKIEFYETSWIRHGVHKLGKETRFLSFRHNNDFVLVWVLCQSATLSMIA